MKVLNPFVKLCLITFHLNLSCGEVESVLRSEFNFPLFLLHLCGLRQAVQTSVLHLKNGNNYSAAMRKINEIIDVKSLMNSTKRRRRKKN